jgi:hypothetical protein
MAEEKLGRGCNSLTWLSAENNCIVHFCTAHRRPEKLTPSQKTKEVSISYCEPGAVGKTYRPENAALPNQDTVTETKSTKATQTAQRHEEAYPGPREFQRWENVTLFGLFTLNTDHSCPWENLSPLERYNLGN